MAQAACLPSLTDSTVVVATPPRSPPQNTPGSLVAMLSGSTSGRPQSLSFTGDRADTTRGGRGTMGVILYTYTFKMHHTLLLIHIPHLALVSPPITPSPSHLPTPHHSHLAAQSQRQR